MEIKDLQLNEAWQIYELKLKIRELGHTFDIIESYKEEVDESGGYLTPDGFKIILTNRDIKIRFSNETELKTLKDVYKWALEN